MPAYRIEQYEDDASRRLVVRIPLAEGEGREYVGQGVMVLSDGQGHGFPRTFGFPIEATGVLDAFEKFEEAGKKGAAEERKKMCAPRILRPAGAIS